MLVFLYNFSKNIMMKKLLLMVLFLCATACLAQEPIKIAVMDLKARQGIDNLVMLSLTDLLCTEIAGFGGYEVIARDDMQAMLEHIADKQLLECDDTKCLAQVGGALGVEQLLAGNIGKVGSVYLINFKLIDINDAKVLNRFSQEFRGDEAGLIIYVKHAVNILFGKQGLDAATLKELEKQAEPAPAMAAPQLMAVTETHPQKPSLKKNILRYGLLTAGVASIGLAYFIYEQGDKIYRQSYKRQDDNITSQEIAKYRTDVEEHDRNVIIFMGASGAFLLGGVITFVF